MARFSKTVWAPLPEAGAPDGYVKTQFIVHSTGDNGTAAATRRYFEGATPNESTLVIGQGPWDPTLQIMDSTDRADANMSASARAISVEVVGDGVGGYNAWQRSELIRLGIEARQHHPGILPRIIPAHTEPGYGWHVMFGAPGPWAGVPKSCPGRQRIKELQTDIFPAIFAGADPEEFTVAQYDAIMSALNNISIGLENIRADGWAQHSGAQGVRATYHAQTQAQIAALAELIGQLQAGSATVDLEAIEAAGRRGAESALEDLRVTVSTGNAPAAT